MTDFIMPDLPATLSEKKDLNNLLAWTKTLGASDVKIKAQRRVKARINGELHFVTDRILEEYEVDSILEFLYGGKNASVQVRIRPISKAYSFKHAKFPSRLRYRYQAAGTYYNGGFAGSITLRELPAVPRKLNRGDLGSALYDSLFPDVGLVLICGMTGSGKSTLMSGVVRERIERDEHVNILEYSQPIEFVYDELLSGKEHVEVDQSEVPDNVPTFAAAIEDALRRDPDIILIGEMRGAETIQAALLAAQTGHLVYSTVHANTVASVFLRILQSLPADSSAMMLGGLIDSIRTIICQDLQPCINGGRVPVREYLSLDASLREKLLIAAQQDVMTVPVVAAQMVKDFGVSKVAAVRQLVHDGLLAEHWIGFYERDYE